MSTSLFRLRSGPESKDGRQPVGNMFATPSWGPDLIPRTHIKKSQMWLLQEERVAVGGASWCTLFKGATALRSFSKPWGQPQAQSSICFPAARQSEQSEQSLPPMSHSFSRCQPPVAPPGGSGEWNQLSLIPKLQVSEIPSLTKARWTGPEEPKVVLISPKGERQTHRHRWTDR